MQAPQQRDKDIEPIPVASSSAKYNETKKKDEDNLEPKQDCVCFFLSLHFLDVFLFPCTAPCRHYYQDPPPTPRTFFPSLQS